LNLLKSISIFSLIVFFLVTTTAFAKTTTELPSLQELIDQTPEGGEVRFKHTRYRGPVVIDKLVILDGRGGVVVDGQGQGSVIRINTDGVVIRNMIITNSGDSHDKVDAGILVRSSKNIISDNRIENTLFGIDMQESHNNEITGNEISSQAAPLGLRGDGIRGWASHRNTFRKNRIHDSRDMVIWYSNDNIIEDNEGWNNRYSLHFMYSGGNIVRRNNYHHNTVGIFLMYSRDIVVENNTVKYSLGGTGVGVGMKEVDNITIRHNKIVYCTSGIYFDLSPFQPDRYNFIKANTIAYNVIGADFGSTLARNILKGNVFADNLQIARVRGNGLASENLWEGNYYSEYEGFDRDGDGYGDFTHNHKIYLDTLWMDDDWMLLFSGSPVISVINLLAKLAPISEPRLLFSDLKPVFSHNESVLYSKANLAYDPPKIDIEEDDVEGVPARFASSDDDEDEEEEDLDDESPQKDANFNRYFLKQ